MKTQSEDDRKEKLYEYKSCFHAGSSGGGLLRPYLGASSWESVEITAKKNTTDEKPLSNLLYIPELEKRGLLTRCCYYVFLTTTKGMDHHYPDKLKMKEKVLGDERVYHAVQTVLYSPPYCQDNDEDSRKQEEKLNKAARSMLDGMVATVTSSALRFCGWLFLTLLRQMTSSVHIHPGQLEVLRKISQENKPILYLPLHFSHFDYILLSLLHYHCEIRTPFVASGDNLKLPLLGQVMRRVGGFFIKRRIDEGDPKDTIYRAVLQTYVTELLKQNQSIEVFIEGTRTRSGLPNNPKSGILSIVVDALDENIIPDVTVVPVCMCYEKLIEGNFEREWMGQQKAPETFFKAVLAFIKILSGYYGHIRVNFGAPSSLRTLVKHIQSSPAVQVFDDTPLTRSNSLYEQVTVQSSPIATTPDGFQEISCNNTNEPLHGNGSILHSSRPEKTSRQVVGFLAEHLVYKSMKCKAMMSTNILSFLLLHHFREGASMAVLIHSFKTITNNLLTNKVDVGFSGDFYDVIIHAADVLGSDLVQIDCIDLKHTTTPANKPVSRRDSGVEFESDKTNTPDTQSSNKESPSSSSSSDAADLEEDDSNSDDSSPDSLLSTPDHVIPTGDYMSITAADEEEGKGDIVTATRFTGVVKDDNERILQSTNQQRQQSVCLILKPVLEIPHIYELQYYSNALTPIFSMQSIAALAVGPCIKYRLSTFEAQVNAMERRGLANNNNNSIQLANHEIPSNLQTSFTRSKLVDYMLELTEFLSLDIILCDVTDDLEVVCGQAVDELISSNCVCSENINKKQKLSQLADELCFEDDEAPEEWLKVNVSAIHPLIAKQSVLASHVEGYSVTATQLTLLINDEIPEKEFISQVLLVMRERVESGVAKRAESSSSEIIRSALRSFQCNNVVERSSGYPKILKLSSDFNDIESVTNLVSRISQFLM